MSDTEAGMLMFNSFGAYTMIVLVVFICLWTGYKKRSLLSKEIIAAIENGADVPFPKPKERNYQNLGLVWSLGGVALFTAIWVSSGVLEAAIWGLLPFALGIAFLLIHKFNPPKKPVEN